MHKVPGRRVRGQLWIGASLLLAYAAAMANWDFALILKNAEGRYGNLGVAEQRIKSWDSLINASTDLPDTEKLKVVNGFFNKQLRFSDDQRNWRQADYWATPVESLVKGAGDCEDYSIAKYFTLRRLGMPAEKLRITYVKALRQNQAHMVLTYYATPTSEPLVLDNLIGQIRPASQRKDLLPVYAFNAEGLYVAGSNTRKSDTKKLSRWQDLLKKMRAEGFAIGEG
ncbi:cysteine protease LapG [Pseudomonas marincola]|uniref:cysteine protease LapG n=1 Tax=Pseudomonas marincola TaxID=437900 RepID=UPI0008F31A77|nr:Predicted transglutaminase-like cysteine proteinase [Pseudomonas marincola]